MEQSPIQVFNQTELKLPFLEKEAFLLEHFLSEKEQVAFEFVEIVFVDETEIVRVNTEFLERDYVTDIISFRYDEDVSNQNIEGTLYCCASRILEQSSEFETTPKKEFLRIIAHGLIHLIGYDDQTPSEKLEMTQLEDQLLSELGL